MENTIEMRFFIKKSEPNSIKSTHAIQEQFSMGISGCPGAGGQAHPTSVRGMCIVISETMYKIRVELEVVKNLR